MGANCIKECTLQNMKDAGCDQKIIDEFVRCFEEDDIKGQLRILSKHRSCLLDRVHEEQKRIDCLDYLIYQLEQRKKEEINE